MNNISSLCSISLQIYFTRNHSKNKSNDFGNIFRNRIMHVNYIGAPKGGFRTGTLHTPLPPITSASLFENVIGFVFVNLDCITGYTLAVVNMQY